jgi:hypothetical protein
MCLSGKKKFISIPYLSLSLAKVVKSKQLFYRVGETRWVTASILAGAGKINFSISALSSNVFSRLWQLPRR